MREFHYTTNVLVQAFLNDTLAHGNCSACAVGNIVADSKGVKIKKDLSKDSYLEMYPFMRMKWNHGTPLWQNVFITRIGQKRLRPENYFGDVKLEIDSTGYTWEELSQIETAFESAYESGKESESMFNGLMAVVDVLADIHGIDLAQKEEAKALFVRH